MTTRRQFLQTSMAAGLTLSLAGAAMGQPATKGEAKPAGNGKKLRILILGGTGFLGPAIIRAAQKNGHSVSTFTRGRTRPGLFKDDEVEKLFGNRDPSKTSDPITVNGEEKKYEGVKSLEGKQWDVVIDDSGYYPRHVKASADLLAPNVGQYIFISSVSAYGPSRGVGDDETAKLAEMDGDPTVENMGPGGKYYGPLKVLCERAVEAACPGKTTIVRPGYIVGPDDPTGRFAYWPARAERGGEILAPGTPNDPIQLVDVRDLGEWLVHLAENKTLGAYDALGPAAGELKWGRVLEACQKASSNKSTLTWVPHEFLKDQEGVYFPIWIPPVDEYVGFHQRNVSKAIKAGLKFRPIEDTCRDTLEWWKGLPEASGRRKFHPGVPDAEKEQEILARFHQQGQSKPGEKPEKDEPKKD
ncbi:MAG TPA: NAD-dependent epimerase/dehydratase family protein [Phycisphaerales bacterium]|nr:NAD-dependent epimerase/dehydratase family protein [Phycisphaerales bacterium]